MSVDTDIRKADRPSKPLYARMKEDLVRRILRGDWRPGELVPSETALAQEYGVSVGTARKAIEELAVERLVLRQRGRGTTIAKADERSKPFRFYRLHYGNSVQPIFSVKYLSVKSARASAAEARALGIARGSAITRVERLRGHDGIPAVFERLAVREDLCPDAAAIIGDLQPASFYTMLERSFHIIVPHVKEQVQVAMADERDAEVLKVAVGSPLLEVTRQGYALNGEVVELRQMRAVPSVHYSNTIGGPSSPPAG